MALHGGNQGISFFERSMCLAADGAEGTASTGDASSEMALDRNPVTYWRSVSSSDVVTETLEVTFAEEKTFDRIFLIDHNFKNYSVKYDVSGTWTDFASVVALSGSPTGITETTYARDTSYYEFTPVTSTKILITVLSTQTANEEKYLNQVIVTEELGTLVGHPTINNLDLSRNLRVNTMLSGRKLVMKSDEIFRVDLDFKDYPASLSNDIDLMFELHDREDNFLIWLCGGKFGTSQFRKQMRGYHLRDVIPVQMVDALSPIYSRNVFTAMVNFSARFEEAVD